MRLPAQGLSTLRKVPASYFVYSAFSYFGNRRGGELPGTWFVRVLDAAGREEAVVRQTLYRMVRDGELNERRQGRIKLYSLSSYATAEVDAGTEKIFVAPRCDWDRRWTLVRVGLRTPPTAKQRERVIALLAVEGFAQIDANLFAHPWPAAERLYAALSASARRDVIILRGAMLNREAEETLAQLWPVDALARRYRRVILNLDQLDQHIGELSDREACLMRFAVVFDYLGVAWDDPGLPRELLPNDWPADEARVNAARAYERLLPGATRFADSVLEQVLGATPQRRGASK